MDNIRADSSDNVHRAGHQSVKCPSVSIRGPIFTLVEASAPRESFENQAWSIASHQQLSLLATRASFFAFLCVFAAWRETKKS